MWERLKQFSLRALSYLHAKRVFRAYKPQSISWRTVGSWLRPYSSKDQWLLYKMLRTIRYFSHKETEEALARANARVLDQIRADGLGLEQVIYMQVHDAGSSSGVMLNLLRDSQRLERSGCRFIDSNSRNLAEVTRELSEGVIIYVDDFAGSGKQFLRVHRQINPLIIGNFVEFFIAPCVAEEAIEAISEEGVDVFADEIHKKDRRILREECSFASSEERLRLLKLARDMYSKHGLGFKKLATMVVFARQCPNSVPLLLRGSEGQEPYCGILPRTTDLRTDYPRASRPASSGPNEDEATSTNIS